MDTFNRLHSSAMQPIATDRFRSNTGSRAGRRKERSHLRRCSTDILRADVKCSATAAVVKVVGFRLAHSNYKPDREREGGQNFCFGQHAAIIFPRARIFRAITARDGGGASQRASSARAGASVPLVLNILRKTFSYKCPVGSSAFTGRIPSPQRFRNCICQGDGFSEV